MIMGAVMKQPKGVATSPSVVRFGTGAIKCLLKGVQQDLRVFCIAKEPAKRDEVNIT
jgi:hypothetical protein